MTETEQPKKTTESAPAEQQANIPAGSAPSSAEPSATTPANSAPSPASTAAASAESPCPDKAAASEEDARSDEQKALDSLSPDAANAHADKDAEAHDARAALESLGEPVKIPDSAEPADEHGERGLPARTVAIVIAVVAALALIALALVSIGAVQPQGESRESIEQRELADAQRSSDGMAVEAIATELFDQMKAHDSAFVSSLATHVDEGFYTLTGYRHADLGVDATMLASWMLADFDYHIDGVYVEGDTATVYATITVRDALSMVNSFYSKAYDYFNSSAALGLDEEAAKARMGQLYQEALAEPAELRAFNATFAFEKKEGAWAVSQDSFNTELSLMFGVYDQGPAEGTDK